MTDQPKGKKLNSRWRKGAVRYSSERTIEHVRFEGPARARRTVKDAPTEARFVERLGQQPGWRNGARISKH